VFISKKNILVSVLDFVFWMNQEVKGKGGVDLSLQPRISQIAGELTRSVSYFQL